MTTQIFSPSRGSLSWIDGSYEGIPEPVELSFSQWAMLAMSWGTPEAFELMSPTVWVPETGTACCTFLLCDPELQYEQGQEAWMLGNYMDFPPLLSTPLLTPVGEFLRESLRLLHSSLKEQEIAGEVAMGYHWCGGHQVMVWVGVSELEDIPPLALTRDYVELFLDMKLHFPRHPEEAAIVA